MEKWNVLDPYNGYYSAILSKELTQFTMWMNLESTMLSERSLSQESLLQWMWLAWSWQGCQHAEVQDLHPGLLVCGEILNDSSVFWRPICWLLPSSHKKHFYKIDHSKWTRISCSSVDTAGQDEYPIFPQTYSIDINVILLCTLLHQSKVFRWLKLSMGRGDKMATE